jgi:hypothetical protein
MEEVPDEVSEMIRRCDRKRLMKYFAPKLAVGNFPSSKTTD